MIEIQDDNFESEVLKSSKITVVDFWAQWCGPCKMMNPIIQEASEELPDVRFCKMDVDASPQTASLHGIMSIPTVLVFKDGKRVDQVVGLVQKEKLVETIKRHL